MTTIARQPDPTPPSGAEPDIWESDGRRDVYTSVGCVLARQDILRCPLVTTIARQDRAGVVDRIRVAIEADVDLTAEQARELAGYLIRAAGIADRWAGQAQEDQITVLSAARDAVLAAYIELRELPGNVGDYLRAALDSISDAEGAAR
ncbi:hypothetical protein [Mycobacterium paragordonae]|uniref:DUF222 domain-containing protein n=1 Tax=Mycobacterium paragordonae TaxID=1389713 RepID=A0ABQ1CAY1_9MYCO|nr:hypothetical protein [Mycobacterium paragordonae]GFG81653.1 hypothetical protein MPRG_49290 [Mycobacterium paragordonae]